jgi:hypothetical protein
MSMRAWYVVFNGREEKISRSFGTRPGDLPTAACPASARTIELCAPRADWANYAKSTRVAAQSCLLLDSGAAVNVDLQRN